MTDINAPAGVVRLALMIERHFPGFVEAYYGPAEYREQAMHGDTPPLEALEDFSAALGRSIAGDAGLTPERRAYLEDTWRAMDCILRILRGDAPGFEDEVRLLYGVTPAWIDETVFDEAQRTLDGILPGSGPLPERVQAFRQRSQVTVETATPVIHWLLQELRRRTRERFSLPAGESVEIAMVADESWRAYNWFLGAGRSRIDFNQDFPMEMWDLPHTVAHEAYPGHHSEAVIKEERLYRGRGQLEHSLVLTNTPVALISEGIAQNALAAVASPDEVAGLISECYARAGLPAQDARVAPAFIDANRTLERVADNQVLLLYRDHAPPEAVMAYGMRHALTSAEDEGRTLRFFQDPLSRSYVYNYSLGRALVAAYLERAADRHTAFYRLLSEPVTPQQLQAAGAPG